MRLQNVFTILASLNSYWFLNTLENRYSQANAIIIDIKNSNVESDQRTLYSLYSAY